MSSGRIQVRINTCSQRKTPSYRVSHKPCCSWACEKSHLPGAAGTLHSQPSPPPSRSTELSNHNLSQQRTMALVNPVTTSTSSCRHRATAHQEWAQPSTSSPTSPFLPQALQVMAHTRDMMFSACPNKQRERQKAERKSQSWSWETRDTQWAHPNSPGYARGLPPPFQGRAALSPRLVSKAKQQLSESRVGCGSPCHTEF